MDNFLKGFYKIAEEFSVKKSKSSSTSSPNVSRFPKLKAPKVPKEEPTTPYRETYKRTRI